MNYKFKHLWKDSLEEKIFIDQTTDLSKYAFHFAKPKYSLLS